MHSLETIRKQNDDFVKKVLTARKGSLLGAENVALKKLVVELRKENLILNGLLKDTGVLRPIAN